MMAGVSAEPNLLIRLHLCEFASILLLFKDSADIVLVLLVKAFDEERVEEKMKNERFQKFQRFGAIGGTLARGR